jgi:hypothetical protein
MDYNRRDKLPDYPKVEIRGELITIINEDGREETWGLEESREIAESAAKDIELGLKATRYVKLTLAKKLNEIMDYLIEQNIPIEYLDEIIYRGYLDVNNWLEELYYHKTFPESKN